ncbi:hypothetical protein IG631_16651 [Alternaria alternata]|nr:hypothetical protein IG631_16651 [Alternaria alternata]
MAYIFRTSLSGVLFALSRIAREIWEVAPTHGRSCLPAGRGDLGAVLLWTMAGEGGRSVRGLCLLQCCRGLRSRLKDLNVLKFMEGTRVVASLPSMSKSAARMRGGGVVLHKS